MSSPPLGRFDVSEVFRLAFRAYRRNAPVFLAVATVAVAPQAAISHRVNLRMFEGEFPGGLELVGLYVVGPAGFALVTALVAWAAARDAAGSPPPVAEYAAVLGRRLLPLVGAVVMLGLLLVAGFFACIVPGVIALVMLYVTVPAVMSEQVGPIAAFGRSSELTEGFRWPVLGIVALLWIGDLVLGAPMSVSIGLEGPRAWSTAAMAVKSIVVVPYQAAVCGVVYDRLRNLREFTDVDRLAEVFD